MSHQEPTIEHLIQALPLNEKVPIIALKALYDHRLALDQQQEAQIQRVHKAYSEKIKPFLQRASQLIQGKDPLPAQVQDLSKYLKTNEKMPQLKGKIIESYWNSSLENSALAQYITQKDEKALQSLLDIQVQDNDNGNSQEINLKFIFKTNPFFNETSIVRKLKYAQGKAFSLQGTPVTWKQGQWLTHESKKVNNKTTGEAKNVLGKKIQSFFDIFLDWSSQNVKELDKCHIILSELMAVIRDSLSGFLGLNDLQGELSDEQQQDYDEEESEQEVQEVQKKKK